MRILKFLAVIALFYLVGSVPTFAVLVLAHAFPIALSFEVATGVGILSLLTPAFLPVDKQHDFFAYLFSEKE